MSESLQAPGLPEWCLEEEEGSDKEIENGTKREADDVTSDGSNRDGSRKRPRRELKTDVGA